MAFMVVMMLREQNVFPLAFLKSLSRIRFMKDSFMDF